MFFSLSLPLPRTGFSVLVLPVSFHIPVCTFPVSGHIFLLMDGVVSPVTNFLWLSFSTLTFT